MLKWVPECLSPAFLKSAKQIPLLVNFTTKYFCRVLRRIELTRKPWIEALARDEHARSLSIVHEAQWSWRGVWAMLFWGDVSGGRKYSHQVHTKSRLEIIFIFLWKCLVVTGNRLQVNYQFFHTLDEPMLFSCPGALGATPYIASWPKGMFFTRVPKIRLARDISLIKGSISPFRRQHAEPAPCRIPSSSISTGITGPTALSPETACWSEAAFCTLQVKREVCNRANGNDFSAWPL